jgi:hypothetical protein
VRNATPGLAERVELLLPGTLCETVIPENARVVGRPDFGVPMTLSHVTIRRDPARRSGTEGEPVDVP